MSIWAKTWAYSQHPKRIDDDGNVTDRKHPAAKAVLVALAEYPGPGQRQCWPSQKTIADMTDYTDRQVRTCMSDLETQGLIRRSERRRKDGTRRSDMVELLGPIEAFGPQQDSNVPDGPQSDSESDAQGENQPEESSARSPRTNRKRVPDQPEESSGHEPPQRTVRKETSSLTNVREEGESDKSPVPADGFGSAKQTAKDEKPEGKPEALRGKGAGQYAVAFLAERLKEAKARGATPPPLTNRQRGEYGEFFAQSMADGDSVEDGETALLWLAAKACGDIPHEHPAWAYYGSGQRAVRDGWRPKASLHVVEDPEARRKNDEEWDEIIAEQEAMIREAMGG